MTSVNFQSTAVNLLQHTFGYPEFRGSQAAIIDNVCQGTDVLVIMPTGGGKSLCYQIPALVRDGVGIVISPLIALMQDQVSALHQLGVKASFLNSTLDYAEVQRVEESMLSGELDLLYIAPERLLQARTLELLRRCNIALFAIDEAHCVSQWGHDFRKDYLSLSLLHEQFPQIPRIALTATADERTRKEIVERLSLNQGEIYVCGFDRPNIHYRIQQKNKAKQQLLTFLSSSQVDRAGIVYCLSRKKVDETAAWLATQGYRALPFHAGLPAAERKHNQDRFLREENIIIVATIAFGMGIDKPDVRFVVHMDMPKSIEAYYQETGRAGRDGEPATAVMFYGFEDVVKLKQMLDKSEGNEMFKRHEQQRLDTLLGLCEVTTCRRQVLLRYFGERDSQPCGNCDNCVDPPSTWDATEASQMALSCVYRTGQRFGAGQIIDVLRGADTAKIRQFQHDGLSTFGIGKHLSQNQWRAVMRQLIALGFLQVDAQGYGALHLTEMSRPVLKGEQKLEFSVLEKEPEVRKPRIADDIPSQDQGLWQALRACRKRLADQHNLPPFVIFHDSTLKDMLVVRPQTEREMLTVVGVGDVKMQKYGELFLQVIREYEYL